MDKVLREEEVGFIEEESEWGFGKGLRRVIFMEVRGTVAKWKSAWW